jgi:DNA polymerase-3 subunit delta
MPLVSPDALARSLKGGKRGGIFFLFGEEEHLKEEAASAIVDAHLDPATRDFNLDQLRGNDLSAETLASVAATPPMMAEWRVVVVRDAHALAASARTRNVLEDLLKREMPGLALVLVATLPEKAKAQIYDRLKREATAVAFPQLAASDVPGWLVARASDDGYELALDAARALAGAIGSELGILLQELRKLYDFAQPRKRITLDDVRAVVGFIPRQNRWEWFDMLGERRFPEARAALPVLLDSGENGVGIVIGIGTHFLRLAILAHGGERALEEALPPYQRWLASRLVRQARMWRTQEIDAALEDLLRADRLLKSTNLGDHAVIEELILRLQTRAHAN